ncbi:radical SAM family heme chaperone HemW [Reichenbachiella agarivorans]|uniref:Heme chaperone HemW n=1 Tax=Reichenbachiella agarivorans TaxID=2979464 RepID=A0ABY6CZS4_9BACT|nr:radical SAM family heme chaperone HemW [Reichenbachiella agarivorans]UXP33750.1 radical SAM family heme chaperone HemW [Reichenbachiella agarivorans]
MSGIYIHIPYCKQACHYCDFHFSTSLQNKQQMVDALSQELKLRKDYLADPLIQTLYFGGGTPSILSTSELAQLIETSREEFVLSENLELTLEANPDDLNLTKLHELKSLGINRLSIGIQSFDDALLKYFNRSHDRRTAIQAVRDAREAGIDNISIDLIFGVPNQSLEMLADDLRQALSLETPHISIYGLTIEEKTVFGKWHKQNKLTPIDEDLASEHLSLIMTTLETAGYVQYEISNFCKPDYQSRHNSSYWAGTHYLGIGPAAHSYNGSSRQYNISHNNKYIQAIHAHQLNHEIEVLTQDEKITEMILTQIRTIAGIDMMELKSQLGYDMIHEKKKELSQLTQSGLLSIQNDRLILSKKGKLLGDYITELLIP